MIEKYHICVSIFVVNHPVGISIDPFLVLYRLAPDLNIFVAHYCFGV